MNKEEIIFNTDEDILFQIAMITYERHNSTIASINDHLGEMYSYKDLEDAEKLELNDEKRLLELAVKQLQKENEQLKSQLSDSFLESEINTNNRLQKENRQLKEQNEDLFNQNRELRVKLEHSIPKEQYSNMLHRKNEQFKQRDEVIEEIREMIDTHNNLEQELGGTIKFNLVKLSSILNKYKGDSNE